MRSSLQIGNLFGISIRIHLSWLIIFGLVSWALATNYFPVAYPEWSMPLTIAVSITTSLLFFSSVLVHEIMHSLVARKYGIPVSSITLFVLGGIAEMTEEPKEPKIELLMAAAGPLTSITLGLIFGILWLGLPLSFEIGVAVSFWLASINLMLGVFNLIPGFPMDGGRILRSVLWWKTSNLNKATYIASKIGQSIGLIFIIAGVVLIFSGFLLNGIWISVIGWFIFNAAGASYQQLTFQQFLGGHKVKEIMTTDCYLIDGNMTADTLLNHHIFPNARRCFMVKAGNSIQGIITLSDIKMLSPEDLASTAVARIMTPLNRLHSVKPDDYLIDAFKIMAQYNINQLPVLSNSNLEGMIARDNLLSFINIKESLKQQGF